jgi:hypothetical protein
LLRFPTVGKDAVEWSLVQPFVDELQATYPDVDVMAECRKALFKIQHGKVTRKTARGMEKFLIAWMERSQNSSRRAVVQGADGDPRGNMQAVRDYMEGSFGHAT